MRGREISAVFFEVSMKSEVVKAILDNQVVIAAVDSRAIVSRAIKLHDLSPLSAAALGRVLTITAIMGASLKNKQDYLTATVKGDGQIGSIVACSNSTGMVKGYCNNPHAENLFRNDKHLAVGEAVGKNGNLTVIKNIGMKTHAVGTVKLVSGEIAEDFAQYFAVSEQQPCAVSLGVLFRKNKCVSSGGLTISPLPNCSKELLDKIETVCYALDEISYLFTLYDAHSLIEAYFAPLGKLVFEESKFYSYKCDCNRNRIEKVIISLGKTEAESIVEEVGFIEVACQFCGKKYLYDKTAVDALFEKRAKKTS